MNIPVNYIPTSEQDELLDAFQRDGFKYFIDKVNPAIAGPLDLDAFFDHHRAKFNHLFAINSEQVRIHMNVVEPQLFQVPEFLHD